MPWNQDIPEGADLLLGLMSLQPLGHSSPGEARRLLSRTFVILFQVLLSTRQQTSQKHRDRQASSWDISSLMNHVSGNALSSSQLQWQEQLVVTRVSVLCHNCSPHLCFVRGCIKPCSLLSLEGPWRPHVLKQESRQSLVIAFS